VSRGANIFQWLKMLILLLLGTSIHWHQGIAVHHSIKGAMACQADFRWDDVRLPE
jgi:hypothetical protein